MSRAPTQVQADRLHLLLARPELARVLDALDGRGEETRVVGGAVRNVLLDVPVHDIDLATTALPAETMRRARRAGLKAVPTGIAHGTVTVVASGQPFEVTTLRRDVRTDGRHAEVAFGRDFDEDAARRDFTMNALGLTREGVLHDPTGGLADLALRHVRFIGDPVRRIREDYLRTLRFFRFHAQYGTGPLDVAGRDAAISERAGLARLSRERVRAELLKLLVAPGAAAMVEEMSLAGLLQAVTGGVASPGRLTRIMAGGEEAPDPILRLAAVLVRVREDADNLRERLRLTNAEYARLVTLADLQAALLSGPPLDRRAARRFADDHGTAAVADAARLLSGGSREVLAADGAMALAALVDGSETIPPFPLSGADVIAAGVVPGPAVGRVLAEARRLWLAADCPLDAAGVAEVLSLSRRHLDSP